LGSLKKLKKLSSLFKAPSVTTYLSGRSKTMCIVVNSLSHSFSLSFSPSLSLLLSLSPSFYPSFFLTLSISVSLFLYPTVSLSLCLSVSFALSLSCSCSLSLSLSLSSLIICNHLIIVTCSLRNLILWMAFVLKMSNSMFRR
jgi:hypothetical protein